ncbi:TerC family protein [Bacillus stercoris]|nr:TerC family protein [Bacillus stercoris]
MEYIGIIVTLIVMEGLLSADNALVLAIMTNKLKDEEQRKRALFYGMWGAIGFRALFIFLGVWLTKLWFIKVLGGLYLAKMVYDHFKGKDDEDLDEDGIVDKYQNTFMHKILGLFGLKLSFFWSIVVSVEMMDLAFSVDSILAALALSNKFWVLLVGGALGILMMRGVAGVFQKLIERVPEMEGTAFILIGLIAVKMLLGTVHNFAGLFGYHMHEIHVSHLLFFAILVLTFLGTFVVHYINKKRGKHENIAA